MSLELINGTETIELDPSLRDEPRTLSQRDVVAMARLVGRVALTAGVTTVPSVYLRRRNYLSPADIDQLESFYSWLRAHYGIPEGDPVFPKREPDGVTAPEPRSVRETTNAG